MQKVTTNNKIETTFQLNVCIPPGTDLSLIFKLGFDRIGIRISILKLGFGRIRSESISEYFNI